MKYAIIFLLLATPRLASAQLYSLKKVESADKSKQFVVVESKVKPVFAERMNAILEKDWGEGVSTEEGDFSYRVGANNDRVFSFVVEYSYAAAGLHIDSHTYHFDAVYGTEIDLQYFISPAGQPGLTKALHKSWKAALKRAAGDTSDPRRDEYIDCLKHADEAETRLNEFMIQDTGVDFWAGSCLEGTTYDFQADKTRGPHRYHWSELLPFMKASGLRYFIGPPSGPFATLMRGTIDGKYPISLALMQYKDDVVGGYLVYDRIGEPIFVKGRKDNNKISFNETDKDGKALSDINVTWDGTKLTGTFLNLKTRKQMPFVAGVVE